MLLAPAVQPSSLGLILVPHWARSRHIRTCQRSNFGNGARSGCDEPAYNESMLKKAIVCLFASALIVGVLASLHVFFIIDGADGSLFWKGDTAYVFLNRGALGYRMSYLQYIGENFKELLGVAATPSDERRSNEILVVTLAGVRHYVSQDTRFDPHVVSNGIIYAGYADGILWKWNHDHFEKGTAQDRLDFAKTVSSVIPGPDYDDVEGWHHRCCLFSHSAEYNIAIDLNLGRLSLVFRRKSLADLSLELIRPDGTKETIWHVDGDARRVSKSVYQQTFAKN
jgi:hypothetical protein